MIYLGGGFIALSAAFLAMLGPPLNFKTSESSLPQQLEFESADTLAVCRFNTVSINKYGTSVVWAGDPPDATAGLPSFHPSFLTIVPVRSPSFRVAGPFNVRPISWSEDSNKLYVRNGDSEIGVIDVDSRVYNRLYEVSEDLSAVRFEAGEEQILDGTLRDFNLPSNIDPRTHSRVWVSIGDEIHIATSDRSSGAIEIDETAIGLEAAMARAVKPVQSRNDSGALIYDGMFNGEFLNPIEASETGEVVGRYRGNSFIAQNASVNPTELSGMLHILDASASNDRLAFLSLAEDLSRTLVTFDQEGARTDKALCRDARFFEPRVNSQSLEAIRVEIEVGDGDDRYDAPAIYYTTAAEGPPKNLIIYFHGGPAATIFDTPLSSFVRRTWSPETAILAPDYPGSSGSLKGQRDFRNRRLRSLQSFSRALDEWILANVAPDTRVFIYTESFGSLAGLMLHRRVGERLTSSIFVAPVMQVPSADRWAEASSMELKDQLVFQSSVFGSADAALLNQELGEITSSQPHSSQILMFFGSNDQKVSVSDIPSDAAAIFRENITVLEGANHQTVFNRQEVHDTLDALMDTKP